MQHVREGARGRNLQLAEGQSGQHDAAAVWAERDPGRRSCTGNRCSRGGSAASAALRPWTRPTAEPRRGLSTRTIPAMSLPSGLKVGVQISWKPPASATLRSLAVPQTVPVVPFKTARVAHLLAVDLPFEQLVECGQVVRFPGGRHRFQVRVVEGLLEALR